MQEFINIVLSNGIFATLFVALLFYQLKDSSQREKKYVETIEKLSKHLDAVEDIKEDLKDIKTVLIKPKKTENKSLKNEEKLEEKNLEHIRPEIKTLKKYDISKIKKEIFSENLISNKNDNQTFCNEISYTENSKEVSNEI